jgi:3-deoxy-D-manno-octulosonate 8-phosphate phosphatase KdsC-like HAD superfamily phosphatase
LVAYLTKWFGEWVIQRLDKAMMAALALAVVAAGAYWLWRQRQNRTGQKGSGEGVMQELRDMLTALKDAV